MSSKLQKLAGAAVVAVAAVLSTSSFAADKTFAIVYPIVHPFFQPVTDRAESYGAEKGVEIITRAPTGADVRQQIEIMENLIAAKVDGIAVVPTDPEAIAPLISKAIAAGIPTIAFESDVEGSDRLGFLGTDNFEAGVHLGKTIVRETGGKGKIIVVTGLPSQRSLNRRIDGIRSVVDANPDLEIVDLQTGQGDPQRTLTVIENQIQAFPDFDVFTSIDATGGPIAVSVWRAKGWTQADHKIITFDDMPINLDGVREDRVTAVISQKQWLWGPMIVDRLLSVIAGEEIPDVEDTGTVEIQAHNVETYRD